MEIAERTLIMIFKKELMIARLKSEGREEEITKEDLEIMENLDGQPAIASCWLRVVHDTSVLWVVGRDGVGQYVNERDCV